MSNSAHKIIVSDLGNLIVQFKGATDKVVPDMTTQLNLEKSPLLAQPSYSTTASYSVTVGAGTTTSLGDYNLAGTWNASATPITAAIAYLTGLGLTGTVFVKKGTYAIGTLTLPAGITLQGEGEATVLTGNINITGNGARVMNLRVSNSGATGITIGASVRRALIQGCYITGCATGVSVSASECIIANNFIADNTVNGVVLNVGANNNIVSSNMTIRNP